MQKVIEVKNLSKIFNNNTVAVNGISFDVRENEVFGLIGPNGSGKTTIQRMLATILEPTSGIIRYYGKELSETDANRIREVIGYVPQGACLYGDLTVAENLDIFSKPYRLENSQRIKNISNLIKNLGLEERKNTLVKNLSGGLAKRASIAIALVHEPKILFLDEATMGLDPNSRYEIWKLTEDLKKKTTIVFTTHYMDEAEKLCDRLAILSQGKILELDLPQKILSKYQAKNLNEVIAQIIKKEK